MYKLQAKANFFLRSQGSISVNLCLLATEISVL